MRPSRIKDKFSRVLRRSIRNFNIPPPRAYPGHLTVHCALGGGNLNVFLEGWGIWTGFISCSDVIGLWIRFLRGLTDLQDRISPLLVNNSLKRICKRRLKVSLRHISLWKARKVLDWRPNLSLRRGSSVLIGGAFEGLSCPKGGNLNKPIFKSSKTRGGVELSNWSAHIFKVFTKLPESRSDDGSLWKLWKYKWNLSLILRGLNVITCL